MCAYLQEKNITHGDIRPELIFVSDLRLPGRANFRLLDRISDVGTSINTQLNNLIIKNKLYVSPLCFEKIAGRDISESLLHPFK